MSFACAHPVVPRPIAADTLHVITMISNPVRYGSRYRLFREFEHRVLAAGAKLWVVEVAFGERPHAITGAENPQHLQLRTSTELWHKENALNLLIARLPTDWRYMAWVDADVLFARMDWAAETVHQLQHYAVVQMFSECMDLSPNYEFLPTEHGGERQPSMLRQHVHGTSWGGKPYGKHAGHCGYAWAIRRDAFDTLGGLIDFSVCGANDHHMARGLIGDISLSVNAKCSPGLKSALAQWGQRAKAIRGNVGYVPGAALHYWHGAKKNRGYIDRWQILANSQFDPAKDLRRDWQGLYQLHDDGSPRMVRLRDDLRGYFRSRDEDGKTL